MLITFSKVRLIINKSAGKKSLQKRRLNMEAIDSIVKDLGASVTALRPQETCICSSRTHTHTYKSMGLLLVLLLVLMLAYQRNFIRPHTPISHSMALTATAPFIRAREKHYK